MSDRKSTRLNSSHLVISYAVFCLCMQYPLSSPFPYTTLFRSSLNVVDGVRAIVRLEAIVAHVVVDRAVEVAAAAFGGGADLHCARAVLGRIVARLNLDFLDHVRVRGDDGPVIRTNVNHARSVDRYIVLFAAQSINVIPGIGICAVV